MTSHDNSTLMYDDLTQQLLQISPELENQVWQESQAFSAPGDRRRAYINRLCLKVVGPWLEEEFEARATVFPKEKSLASVWEVVGGFAVEMKGKRLVIVPTEAVDRDELRVPQEWVEIPSWSGDYYLAVQVNPEGGWVQVWGYATHAVLKEKGDLEQQDRAYSLDGEEIVRDLSLLTLACEGYIEEPTRSRLQALAPVSAVQAENKLQQLGNPQKVFPRLELPFPLWGALLEQEEWRDRLYHLRQGQVERVPVNLRQWLENLFELEWHDLSLSGVQAVPVRARSALENLRKDSLQEVQRIKLIELDNPNEILLPPMEVVEPSPTDAEMLVAKEKTKVGLIVEMTPQNDDKMQICLQLHPMGLSDLLPEGIELTLLESEKVLRSVQARRQDNYIQLPLFTGSSGDRFNVRISLGDRSVTEVFHI